jgi:hypothetical protein
MRQSGEYGRTGQAAGENIAWRTRIACLITKATDTHLEYVILRAFPLQKNGYAKAPQYYTVRSLPVLLTNQSSSAWNSTLWHTVHTWALNVVSLRLVSNEGRKL